MATERYLTTPKGRIAGAAVDRRYAYSTKGILRMARFQLRHALHEEVE